eukprot:1145733-Pelagomonas_calceolata.AAC.1
MQPYTKVEFLSSCWHSQEHTSDCDRCDPRGLQDKVHAKQTNETNHLNFKVMDISCATGTVQQADLPNSLAEGQIPFCNGRTDDLGQVPSSAAQCSKALDKFRLAFAVMGGGGGGPGGGG